MATSIGFERSSSLARWRLVVSALVVVVASETIAMWTIAVWLPDADSTTQIAVDLLILVLLSAPLTWFLVVAPLFRMLQYERRALAALFEAAPDGIITSDAGGIIRAVNTAAARMCGYAPEQLLGMSMLQLMPAPGQPGQDAAARAYLERGRPRVIGQLFETNIRRLDGTVFGAEASVGEIAIPGEHLYISHLRDVTERKQVEVALLSAERMFRAVVEQSFAGIFILQDGLLTYANPRAEEMTGYALTELFACSPYQLVHQDDWEHVAAAMDLQLRGRAPSLRYNYRIVQKNGTVIDVEAYGTLMEIDGRQAILGVSIDVTEQRRGEELLRRERDFTAAVLSTAGALILVRDHEGRIVRFNRECERVTGFGFEEVRGRYLWDVLLPPEEIKAAQGIFANPTVGEAWNDYEGYWLTRCGERRLISWSSTVTRDGTGRIDYVVTVGKDITDREKMETALRDSESRLREITATLGEGVYVLDREGRITWVNPEGERLLGWSQDELLGKCAHHSFHYLLPDGQLSSVRDCPANLPIGTAESYRAIDDVFVRKDGTLLPVSFVSRPIVRGGEVVGSVGAFHDITELKNAMEQIGFLANHDGLTGLPNRRLLADRLKLAMAQAQRGGRHFALLTVDLDHFKEVNDSLGHDAGDELLKVVAERLTGCVRAEDTVARVGGDEFVLVLSDLAAPDDAGRVASKLLEVVAAPVLLGEQSVCASVSVGISVYPDDGLEVEELLRRADQAMYQAKGKGRNGWACSRGFRSVKADRLRHRTRAGAA